MLSSETLLRQRYRLERPLGHGGMATVYRARDEATGDPIAVKLVLAESEPARLAFEREAHLLAQLNHPALPAVIDSFSADTAHYLVMSFVPGADLAEQLTHRADPFPHLTVLDWADQLLEVLGYLHSRQPRVIHRDIKPHNLKLGGDGRVVLLDFGLAKGLSGSEAVSLAGYTVSYAPPEQLRGGGTEPRSDLYALAATLYELLTRRRPPDALQREAAVVDGQPDPLVPANVAVPAVPAAVAAVIAQALALRPSGRPATARSMQVALREAVSGPVTVLAPVVAEPDGAGLARRPTGTVAFLATELVLWEPASIAALARHDSLLRAAVDAHDGFVFRNGDDGLSVAFPTAEAALAAALDAQRALRDEPWGDARPMAVRMALQAGAATLASDEYVSAVLPRLTRLLAAGHGGQILVPRAVQELLGGRLPPGVGLRDLGSHRLPDLAEPEHVFQVDAADLLAEFSPLVSQEVRSTGLPSMTTALVGRQDEMATLGAQLRQPSVRLVTLTGPGGTGKTRLALATAEAMLDDFVDGVYFVALAAVRDPALVVAALCQAFGVREGPGLSLDDALHAELRDRHVLLVLDNVEQVLAAGASVDDLLAATRHLKVLVTSRIPFRLDTEREFPVPTLAYPTAERLPPLAEVAGFPAVELFVARARAAQADFALTVDNVAAVAGICARLDGLPLAIELAAARVNLFAPAELLARLTSRLPVLTAVGRDLPARQQTLRATLAWSYDLLAPSERQLFARLGVFAGGFDLEAADAICVTTGDTGLGVVVGLEALSGQSLLPSVTSPTGDVRYLMLETVREYAAERLAASDEDAVVRQRHAEYFLALAEAGDGAIAGPNGGAWIAQLAVEHDNLRAALDWLGGQPDSEQALTLAAALWRFWQVHGHLTEGRRRLEGLLADNAAPPTTGRARALVGAGALAWRQHDATAAQHWLDEAVRVCRTVDEPAGLATALKHLGLVALYAQPPSFDESRRFLEESLLLRRSLNDLDGSASCLNDLAVLALRQEDYDRAGRMLEESLTLCRKHGSRYILAFVLNNLSLVALEQGDLDRVTTLLEESLAVARELGGQEGVGCALDRLACLAAARAQPVRAARLFGAAEALRETVGAPLNLSERVTYERHLALARNRLDAATWEATLAEGRDQPLDALIDEAMAALSTA
ncbi:MAG TPA: protein kinase [Thermomicrobiales bacterium]|nr:protein kinase [Thermomicrobiales bacterium]